MSRHRPAAWIACILALLPALARAADADPLAPWRKDVAVKPVGQPQDRHTIHSYFNTCPESPDGKYVLFYSSTTRDSHNGQIRILDRATGAERLIADNLTTEDAHRAACQQWISRGQRIAYHDVRDNHWLVACVDLASGKEQILIRDRQAGWGYPDGDVVPVYSCHWNPGPSRDLEIVDAKTLEVRKVVTADAVTAAYPEWCKKTFGDDKPLNIFFPVMSPDGTRVFFKMAKPGPEGVNFRSKQASQREGKVMFDLTTNKLLGLVEQWGHPAWCPDSRTILEVGSLLIDSTTKKARRIPDIPGFKGSHPSVSPDGKLFVTDTTLDPSGKEWGIVVGSMAGGAGQHLLIHKFDHSKGAASWRRAHPHPIFSPDGKRIYFNVSTEAWTRLYVAEVSK